MWLEVSATTERPAHLHRSTPAPIQTQDRGASFARCLPQAGSGCWRPACCWLHHQGRCWHEGCLQTISPTHRTQCRGQPVPPHLSWRGQLWAAFPVTPSSRNVPAPVKSGLAPVCGAARLPADATCSAPLRIARTKWEKIWEENKQVSPHQGPATMILLGPCRRLL